MNWLNAFELICYIIVVILLIDTIRKKDYHSLFTFGAAALVGFAMELLAVSVTDIYYYSKDFWLSLGKVPHQFPVFGGLMWGGLTVYSIELANKFGCGKLLTGLIAGMFVVTMDILLDVVAIRLNGGFWTWAGSPVTLAISNQSFMSVIWVNFLGYMIETPAVVFLTLRVREKTRETDFKKQTLGMFFVAIGGIVITAAGSLVSLLLNSITNNWFSCIAFLAVWLVMLGVIIKKAIKSKLKITEPKRWDIPMLLFWLALYAYCIAAVISLNIHAAYLWFLVIGIFFAIGTAYFCIAEQEAM